MEKILQIASKIEDKISLLERGRNDLEPLAKEKARATAEYDKALSIAIIKLKDGGKYPATLIEKVAKGNCSMERASVELAEARYKLTVTKMQAIQAELNGYQSIFRYLDAT